MATTGGRWQAWAGFALGLWLAVSPWAADYADYPAATANAVFVGVALALGSHFQAAALRECRGQWLNLAAGLWLVAAPFYLGYANHAATAAAVCVGLFVVALAGSALRWSRQEAHLR